MLTDADRAACYANEFDMIVLIRNALRSVDQLPAESTASQMPDLYWRTAQCPVGEDPEATQYDPEGDDPGRVTAETHLSDEEVVELYNRARRVVSLLQPLVDAMQSQIGNEMALRLEIERLGLVPDTHHYKAELMENKATMEAMLEEDLARRPAVFRRFMRVFDELPLGVRHLLKP